MQRDYAIAQSNLQLDVGDCTVAMMTDLQAYRGVEAGMNSTRINVAQAAAAETGHRDQEPRPHAHSADQFDVMPGC